MVAQGRGNRIVHIRLSAHVIAKGYFVGRDNQGRTIINLRGNFYRGKALCQDQTLAAA